MFVFVFPSASVPTLPTSIFLYFSLFSFLFLPLGSRLVSFQHLFPSSGPPFSSPWRGTSPTRPHPHLYPFVFPKDTHAFFLKKMRQPRKKFSCLMIDSGRETGWQQQNVSVVLFACCAKALRPVVWSTLSGAVDLTLFPFHFIIYIFISNSALVYSVGNGWVSGSATKGHLGKTVFGHDENVEGKRFREEGNPQNNNRNVLRVRSDKSNADAKDKLGRPLHPLMISHRVETACWDQCQGSPCLPHSLITSRLYFVVCTPTTTTPLYTRKIVQTHPRKE